MIVERMILVEEPVEGKPLGRHVEHDPRSKDYPFTLLSDASALQTVEHKRHGSIFDQGQIGSCTGNAMAGARNTEPVFDPDDHVLTEMGALTAYIRASIIDGFPGYYPAQDTGSSGLAVAKAAKQMGWIKGYSHAFSIDAALTALQSGPVITGVHWYEGFDSPDENGLVQIAGQIRGGHEIVARGYQSAPNPDDALILLDNSWGTSYGKDGHFFWTVATWRRLLNESGDATILVP